MRFALVFQLQGIVGPCPPEFAALPEQDCPPHDLHCGCHGPTMTKGMVGWAGGGTGPDFFINVYDDGPVDWWGQQHTVWGIVDDKESLDLIVYDVLLKLPIENKGGMQLLQQPFDFQMKI